MTRAALAALLAAAATSAAAIAALPAFGTAPRSGSGTTAGVAVIAHVRVGRHAAFDRVVFEFASGRSSYSVQYVPRVVHDGSGLPVRLAGRAFLHLVFHHARIDRPAGSGELVRTPAFPALRQVKEVGNFEAVASFGLGLTRKAGFRVFGLSAPPRVVVDVAH